MRPKPAPPQVSVAAGIILRGGRVLLSRRLPGAHLEGAWEFPGGKIPSGEEPEAALRRELAEEIGVRVEKAALFHREHHAYHDREVDIHFYIITGLAGEPAGAEGQEVRWVDASDLRRLRTPAANARVLRMIEEQLGGAPPGA